MRLVFLIQLGALGRRYCYDTRQSHPDACIPFRNDFG